MPEHAGQGRTALGCGMVTVSKGKRAEKRNADGALARCHTMSPLDTLDARVSQLSRVLWPESWSWQTRAVLTGVVTSVAFWCFVYLALVIS
jgi:hypothetical protein